MRIPFLLLLILTHFTLQAAEIGSVRDSVDFSFADNSKAKVSKFEKTNFYQISYASVPLIAAGLMVKIEDEHFKSLRMDYMPTFRNHTDDYLQYAPAVAMLGLKLAGVKSRSSWGRLGVSDAFSVGVMATLVNTLKYTTHVTRPNHAASNSFPSGHTATAFMTATMLHKEFGDLSRWYSVGGYTLATATGLMRMSNNKHWLSDVLVGAGIGILSTNLGYFLADLIFKDKGLNEQNNLSKVVSWHTIDKPHYLSLTLGLSNTIGNLQIDDGVDFSIERGSRAGLDGAYFLNKNWGIGGSVAITNSPIKLDNVILDESLSVFSSYAGIHYAYPLTNRLRIGGKFLSGYNFYQDSHINRVDFNGGGKFGMRAGMSIDFLSTRMWAMKVFGDYDAIFHKNLPASNVHQVIVFGATGTIIF